MSTQDQKTSAPVIVWFRRDLRLGDHPALFHAVATGRPVICLFIADEEVTRRGAAPKWRLSKSLAALAQSLIAHAEASLILRRGVALDVLDTVIQESGAGAVYWNRCYSPDEIARDSAIKAALKAQAVEARSFRGSLMFEPHEVQNKSGSFFKVYSPFWRAVRPLAVTVPLPTPPKWQVAEPLRSDALEDWGLEEPMRRGARALEEHVQVGEAAAQETLAGFEERVDAYAETRNTPSVNGTSGLSAALALGEISPNQIYHHLVTPDRAMTKGLETYIKEIVWREFAYHLMYHTPHILTSCWRPEWDQFKWESAPDQAHFERWCYGMTGYEFVDAAMREMYVTGTMHNRSRMIVASFLTKHMGIDWRLGMRWFEDCLVDWDPASNAMGWQWVAGCGPDASPYFRVFNPITQLEKFDSDGAYVAKWLNRGPSATKTSHPFEMFFQAVPKRLGLTANMAYPDPVVEHNSARQRALQAYEAYKIIKGGDMNDPHQYAR